MSGSALGKLFCVTVFGESREPTIGCVLGGISTGQNAVVHLAIKPTSSLRPSGRSVDFRGNPTEIVIHGRHDPCAGIRATPLVPGKV
jgi:chorismate synthase